MKQPHSATPPRLAIACLSLAAAAPAAAAPYLFTEVAQTEAYPVVEGQFYLDITGPAVNASGVVAFRRYAGGVDGVYARAPGGAAVPVATTASGAFAAFGPAPDINAAGQVVFHARGAAGGQGLYVAAPGGPPPATIAHTATGAANGPITHFGHFLEAPALPAINDSGVVVCAVETDNRDYLNFAAILRYENGAATFVDQGRIRGSASLNNRGEAAYVINGLEVRAADAAGPRTVARLPQGGMQSLLVYAAASNDLGTLMSGYEGGGVRVVLLEGGTVTEIRTTPAFLPFYGGFSLNNTGDAAFLAPLSGRIYAGNPGQPDLVVGVGDPLFGSTVTDLNYSREGFNDAGQVAFWASLADGRNVIALATPVPEPAAAALLLISGAFPTLRRRRLS